MKIAIVGGTHGNEPIGIEVMHLFKNSSIDYINDYECFWGNPKAFELKKRYVDTDLNRAFGKAGVRKGYEATRAEELEAAIKGKFDLCIDLHTTTSNMGLTMILNNTHENTRKACVQAQERDSKIKLIEENKLDEDCVHLNRLCPAGVTIEVGPVANNVIRAELVFEMYKMVESLLEFDFLQAVDTSQVEYYKMLGQINYPDSEGWYLDPKIDGHDFRLLKPQEDCFVNIKNEKKLFEHDKVVYPFFVNEAAYLENKSAFLIAAKKHGF